MKVIILAGGFPSTIIEQNEKKPKPMAEIGGKPILWHIMKQYSYYGYNDFIICTGYKGEIIKEYFMNFYIYQSDITVDLRTNNIEVHRKQTEDWKVSIIDTGMNSSIIERLLAVEQYIDGEKVLISYGDCLSNINIKMMVDKHNSAKYLATFAVAHPTGRNEIVTLDKYGYYDIKTAEEKKKEAWVNACCMVLEPNAFTYFKQDMDAKIPPTILDVLARYEKIQTYYHDGFWSPVETMHDKTMMEILWAEHNAPWKVWQD